MVAPLAFEKGKAPGVLPSACTAAARFTRWSASSMASAGPRGSSRDSPMTRIRIRVSSRMGTSEQRRRKKLQEDRGGEEPPGSPVASGQTPIHLSTGIIFLSLVANAENAH